MPRHLTFKKVFAPWFLGLQKKCLPRDFQKENNSAPRDFFDHKKSPPRDLRCAKKYPPRCILTGPVSDKFCQLPKHTFVKNELSNSRLRSKTELPLKSF